MNQYLQSYSLIEPTAYLNNMRRPKACTDELVLIGNMFYFQLNCPDCAILLEKGHHASNHRSVL